MNRTMTFEIAPRRKDGSRLFDFKLATNLSLLCGSTAPCEESDGNGECDAPVISDEAKRKLKKIGIAAAAVTAGVLAVSVIGKICSHGSDND